MRHPGESLALVLALAIGLLAGLAASPDFVAQRMNLPAGEWDSWSATDTVLVLGAAASAARSRALPPKHLGASQSIAYAEPPRAVHAAVQDGDGQTALAPSDLLRMPLRC